MEGMGDVILVMVCLEVSNPIENIPFRGKPLPYLF